MQCPVLGCHTRVPRQRGTFRTAPEFLCHAHRIYIGRSTFEYERDTDHLLWKSPDDLNLLAAIKSFKRESRLARERSEDALTWNVFRHLEASRRLQPWLDELTGVSSSSASVHYWSFDASTGNTWAPLAAARAAFGEVEGRGSEPDLVITTDAAVIWVEAKFGSSNSTRPSEVDGSARRYTAGANGWYSSVVASSFQTVAVEHRRYELLRLWLLGSWAASQLGKHFLLVNLVRDGFEEDVPSFAAKHLRQGCDRVVRRDTWESIRRGIEAAPPLTADDVTLVSYMRDKTLGYSSRGRLERAFAQS